MKRFGNLNANCKNLDTIAEKNVQSAFRIISRRSYNRKKQLFNQTTTKTRRYSVRSISSF